MANKIQLMRGTKAQLTAKSGLSLAEPGYCTDTKDFYIGNASGGDTLFLSADNIPYNVYRQAIINGNFDVWQRGANISYSNNFGAGNASGYGPDRWSGQVYGSGGGTSAFTHQIQTFTPGQTTVPGNPKFFERFNVTSLGTTGAVIRLSQAIESAFTFAGQRVTLSFWAKASSARSISAVLSQQFGSGGSPSATVDTTGSVTSLNLTTSWQKFVVTFDLPSVTGKTLGSSGNDTLLLQLVIYKSNNTFVSVPSGVVGTYATGSIDLASVQLGVGGSELPFQPRSLAEELSLCQRYYWTSYRGGAIGGFGSLAASTTALVGAFQYPSMRVPPTLKISVGGVADKVRKSTDNSMATVTGASFLGLSDRGFSIVNVPAVLIAGSVYDFDIEADAEF